LFMILKLVAIAALVVFGLTTSGATATATPRSISLPPTLWNSLTAFGAALIPVQFAYGGWQTSCFVAGEVREPKKNLPRGFLFCDGGGRLVLFRFGQAESCARACARDRPSRRICDRDHVVRALRTNSELRDFSGCDLLRADGGHCFYFPKTQDRQWCGVQDPR